MINNYFKVARFVEGGKILQELFFFDSRDLGDTANAFEAARDHAIVSGGVMSVWKGMSESFLPEALAVIGVNPWPEGDSRNGDVPAAPISEKRLLS